MEQRIEQEVRRNDQLSSDIDAAQRQARNTVRVLRLIEYAGEREEVERQVRQSIHGTIAARRGKVLITAVTLHEYPEILAMARMAPAQNVVVDGSHEGVPDLGSSTNPSRHRS